MLTSPSSLEAHTKQEKIFGAFTKIPAHARPKHRHLHAPPPFAANILLANYLVNCFFVQQDETVPMGAFDTMHCFSNDPYECEMVFDLVAVAYTGDIKCQICNIDGERQWVGLDEASNGQAWLLWYTMLENGHILL